MPADGRAPLAGAAHKLGFTYTRYADDLTFNGPRTADTGAMLDRIRFIATAEGFAERAKKTRVLRRGRRQEVTGVVVNQQLGVDRETLRKFRALLFQIGKDGPAGKSWGASPDLFASAIGYANYVRMVDPTKGESLPTRAKELAAKHGWQPPKPTLPHPLPRNRLSGHRRHPKGSGRIGCPRPWGPALPHPLPRNRRSQVELAHG